ncbi:MAG: YceI family protein, partial [Pseudomonadota bacterium]
KNDFIGEAHTFSGLSGSVGNDGAVNVSIDLTTLNTNIDIRNERMAEHVFAGAASAEISANVDLAEIKKLRPGQSMQMEIDATMMLLGNEVDVFLDAYVLRVSPSRVMVSTNTASYLSTEDLGVNAGIDVLQGLANLDSITRVTPVTLRLMFDR